MKTWTDAWGKERTFTQQQIVETYLEGRIDHYSGGELEHMRQSIENLRRNTAELLIKFGGDDLVEFCEKELE